MKELKIDQEFKELLPPLSLDEKAQLEKSLKEKGYLGAPIYTWHGFIIDGHNRYELCRKNDIEYSYEEIVLGDNSAKIDVMEWMINTQLGRRNLIPAQRLVVLDRFKKRVQEEAKERQVLAGGDKKSENRFTPNGEKRSEPTQSKIHTDKQLAKMAGVGTGTVARFNKVMKSEDEELKKDVVAGNVSINAGYEKVKEKEKPKEKLKEDQSDLSKSIAKIAIDMKEPRNVADYWNFLDEVECLQYDFKEPIEVAFDRFFGEYDISNEIITEEEKVIAVNCINEIIGKVNELKNKIKNVKVKGVENNGN